MWHGLPVSPVVSNLYMDRKALGSLQGTTPSYWYRYADDTWVKIKIQELESFTAHINTVDRNAKFTREDTKDNSLPFLDCAVQIEENGNLNIEVYRKSTHTNQYLLFDSHHPLEYKLGSGPYNTGQKTFPLSQKGIRRNTQTKKTLKICGYSIWAFIKSAKMHTKKVQTPTRENQKDKSNNTVIPYVVGLSEKLRRVVTAGAAVVWCVGKRNSGT